MSFSHQFSMRVFHQSVSDSKFLQAFRTLLSILANFNNTAVWMVSILSLVFIFPSLFSRLLETVPRYHCHLHIIIVIIHTRTCVFISIVISSTTFLPLYALAFFEYLLLPTRKFQNLLINPLR